MEAIYHFYLTFNPNLNEHAEVNYTQAHEFYDQLKDLKSKDASSTLFWGKMINKDRTSSLDIEIFNKILTQNSGAHFSTHLFITDFQHLWAGKIKSVVKTLPKEAHTLAFYSGKNVEVWFEIEDFILLEHSHHETAKRLTEFHHNHQFSETKILGLSPFTTSIRYPCIIEDKNMQQYFDEFDQSECTHLILKENPAITKNNAKEVLRNIYLYAFPEELYAKFPQAAKLEIETAEMDMLEQKHHNLQKIASCYLRALEVVMNDLIIHHIKRKGLADQFFVDATSAPAKLYFNQTKDYFITLKEYNKNFSLNNILHFVDWGDTHSHIGFKKAFSDQKEFIRFVTKELAEVVKNNYLIEIRNALAHGENEKVSAKDAMSVRNIILGSGGMGILAKSYLLFYKEKYQHLYHVCDFDQANANSNNSEKKARLKLVA
jgi:hypothetical protein